MAFDVHYRMEWTDQFHNQDYDFKVDFEEENYVGSVVGLNPHGFNITHDEEDWVAGSEAVASFYVDEDDTSTYDSDFYQSAYKTFKMKFYVNNVLKWVGWLKPENTTREFDAPWVLYQVSATDGLNDLKNLEYDGYIDSGKQSLLQLIKNAISTIGLDDMDFWIQCNTFENNIMTDDENLYEQIQGNNEAFYSVKDGEEKSDKAYDVLEKIVKPHYCRLYMDDGYWKIVNGAEYSSYKVIYDYATLAVGTARSAVDREVAIDGFHHPANDKFELSTRAPLAKLRIIFRNKNKGGNELTNGDFSSGTSNWTNSGWDSFTVSGEEAKLVETSTNADEKSLAADSVSLSNVTQDDVVEVRYKIKLDAITFDATGLKYPIVKAVLIDPNTNELEGTGHSINVVGGGFTTITDYIAPGDAGSGTYQLKIVVTPHPTEPTTNLEYSLDDVVLIHRGTANTTSDSLSIATPSITAYKEIEEEIYISDSLQSSDLGGLSDISSANNLTSSWTRYNESGENISLIRAFAQQYCNDHQDYHEFITLSFYDREEEITFDSILTYNSKKYRWVNMSKDFKTKLITGSMVQVDSSSDVTMSFQQQYLTTVMGESTTVSSTLVQIEATGATQTWVDTYFPRLAASETITGDWNFTGKIGMDQSSLITWSSGNYNAIQFSETAIMWNKTSSVDTFIAFLENCYYDNADTWRYKTSAPASRSYSHGGRFYVRQAVSGTADDVISWENSIQCTISREVVLYYQGGERLRTSSTGLTIGGQSLTGTKIGDWDQVVIDAITASGTYNMTGSFNFTGTLQAGGASITSTTVGNWNTAFGWGNHASEGYAQLAANETASGSWSITSSWAWTSGTGNGIRLYDNTELRFGNANDFDIFFNGNHLYIDQQVSTANDIYIRNVANSNQFIFDISAATLTLATGGIYYIGTASITETKISDWDQVVVDAITTSGTYNMTGSFNFTGTLQAGGASITSTTVSNWNTAFGWGNHSSEGYAQLAAAENVTGDWYHSAGSLRFNDNIHLRFGTGSDWRVFSTGTHLYIDQEVASSNDLYIRDTANATKFQFDISAGMLICTDVRITV